MAQTESLIDFDIIENQKENIAALPSGRSAKSLAQLYSPVLGVTSPAQTQDANSSARQEYDKELAQIDESDDPLDVYDRYVRWTLDAYPSTSATPASQLLPLLERATKALLKFDHYKNDPRYLKLWLHYIRLFSDAPRETFCFLARNRIGDRLALYYEEYAAWLEAAGRWNQAEEIYKLGLEKEARPMERLARKFGEFEKRAAQKPSGLEEPSSPALPVVRPVLATKVDPFALVSPPPNDPQAASRSATSSSNSKKPKLQIFADDGDSSRPSSGDPAKGWDNIGTLAERRKENVKAPQPWTGEGLGAGIAPNVGVPKMAVFKDKSSLHQSMKHFRPDHPALDQQAVNPKTGRIERVFVNLGAIYPNPEDISEEYCFEELRAARRGWLGRDWSKARNQPLVESASQIDQANGESTTTLIPISRGAETVQEQKGPKQLIGLNMNDENNPDGAKDASEVDLARRLKREEKANRTRKIRVKEVRGETQTIQVNLDSPQGPKLKRKKQAEPTMTLQTRAAMDEIYEMFNETLTLTKEEEEEEDDEVEDDSGSEEDEDDEEDDEDDYTSAGESTGTGRISASISDYGEDTQGDLTEAADTTATATGTATSEIPPKEDEEDTQWSEFTNKHLRQPVDQETARSDVGEAEDSEVAAENEDAPASSRSSNVLQQSEEEDEVATPASPEPESPRSNTFFIPIPPEGYNAPTRPYRDPEQVAASRLPFMTPIVEKTESSLGTATAHKEKDYFASKTPCPKNLRKSASFSEVDEEIWSPSPLRQDLKDVLLEDSKSSQPLFRTAEKDAVERIETLGAIDRKDLKKAGPIVKDKQCNPMEPGIRTMILNEIQPPLRSFSGFYDHEDKSSHRKGDIRRYCKSLVPAKSGRAGGEKSCPTPGRAPGLDLEGSSYSYLVKRELGAGAYAPVYLVEHNTIDPEQDKGGSRRRLEALKMEEPPCPWEFYIIRTSHERLGNSRAAQSIVQAYEMHMFKDECFLFEEYQDQGTLLDLVNAINDQNHAAGGHSGIEETLAMFFTVELLRAVEALHSHAIIHGDLKADNVLLRLSRHEQGSCGDEEPLLTQYKSDGSGGWSSKGITLIDFGRGIDMQAFTQDVQFIADWETSTADCAEMRELRPWTFQVDYHGVAAIVHTMLFGKYIDIVVEKGACDNDALGGSKKIYKLKEGLKRYWQTELWQELFTLLLNPTRLLELEDGHRLPCSKSLQAIREKMEAWLESHADRGVGLRAMIRRAENVRKRS